mmetsp:Transcript_5044/g.10211  ORF Transcript_5044/g.10211 Transcript_5044/m.10211 type:complete len:110 (-) Transcript_5044:10-339(-)
MCKHVYNAQVVFQASCCRRWFECSECHDEVSDHQFEFQKRLKMFCKPCSTTFERDLKLLTIKDKNCYVCGNCWCIPGVTPESAILEESLSHLNGKLGDLLDMAGSALFF